MNNFQEIAEGVGQLVTEKNAAYGSSFARAGSFLRLLYPEGIQAAQYDDALLLVRIFDKQMRIATDRDALGESPYQDIAGYGILGVHMHRDHKEQQASCQGTVSAVAAASSPASPCDSAVLAANATITTSANAGIAPEPSQQPRNFFGRLDLASASVATAAASESVVDLATSDQPGMALSFHQMRHRSSVLHCAACGKFEGMTPVSWILTVRDSVVLCVCSVRCRDYCLAFSDSGVENLAARRVEYARTIPQNLNRWLSRIGHGRCAACESYFVPGITRYEGKYVDLKGELGIGFCSPNCLDFFRERPI